MESGKHRSPVVAGTFYPADKTELRGLLAQFFRQTKTLPPHRRLKALIVPHAGYIYSGQTAAWGYQQLPKDKCAPHFVLIGPSHAFQYSGLAASSSGFWTTPLGEVKQSAPKRTNGQIVIEDNPHRPEHSLEVQLPFLQYRCHNFSISAFLTGDAADPGPAADYFLQHYPTSVFVISSDLSHYLPETEARARDKNTIRAITRLDTGYFRSRANVACGAVGISIGLAMAKKTAWKGTLIHYDTSAAASGDKLAVVGYASVGFYE